MNIPKSQEEVIQVVNQYHKWIASNGNHDLYPKVLEDELDNFGWIKFLSGVFLHTILFVVRYTARKLHLWPIVAFCAYLRIKTDRLSHEPRQCGYNEAYTVLGLYRLRRKNITGAILALNESWHVWPCCHNTSFGLRKSLAKELSEYPEAVQAVEQYFEVADAFKA